MKTIFFILCVFCFPLKAQYHITYSHKVSDISSTKEDLYIKDKEIISIRDSVMIMDNSLDMLRKNNLHKIAYIKDATNIINIDTHFEGKHYIIKDEIPKIEWEINPSITKNILGYACMEAKGYFRGSNLVAYFTKDIPISAGPFKFLGLDGVILEIYEEGKEYNSWKAVKIDSKFKGNVPYSRYKKVENISLKDYVALEEAELHQYLKNITRGANVSNQRVLRNGIEKIYEWENQ